MREFTPETLSNYLGQGQKPLLLDVREAWEYQICRLDQSTHVPMSQVTSWSQNKDPQQEIVVICHHGIRSRLIARQLEYRGFTNVINLSGGLDAWARTVDLEMPTY